MNPRFKLRDYQVEIAQRACQLLHNKRLCYIAAEVRTGKSHMAMEAARLFGAQNVLFVTKIKAFKSIEDDYQMGNYPFQIKIINRESVHRIWPFKPDFMVLDEAHMYGAYPKESKNGRNIRDQYGHLPIIFMSGTPTPESYSQIFHQLHISKRSPWGNYSNFYKWAADYVKVYQRKMGYATVNMYDRADKSKIDLFFDPIKLTFTQKEAGFQTKVDEHILTVPMKPITYEIIQALEKDFVFQGKNDVIVADTGAKLLSKIHQLSSGTVILESGSAITIDDSKAIFIREKFRGKKVAIFYKFKQELVLLQNTFGEDLTVDLEEFNTTSKNIALQYVSGREGISLKAADYLVALTPDYSATTYFQFKDRMSHMNRLENEMYWIFADNSIEPDIYKKIMGKKKYTTNHYLKLRGITIPEPSKETVPSEGV